MEENVIVKSKSQKLAKRIASMREDINTRRIKLRVLEKDLEKERAAEICKMLEQSGMSIEEAKTILKLSHSREEGEPGNEQN